MASKTSGNIDAVVDEILDYQVDAIILASVAMSSNLATRCVAAGLPVILFNRTQDDDRFSTVTSDNFLGGQKVARFLIAGGHKRIGYIAGWEGASTQRDREAGFIEEMTQHGMSLYAREVGNFVQDNTRYDYWKRMEFSESQWTKLKSYAESKNLVFLCTPFSEYAVDLLESIGILGWKIGSAEFEQKWRTAA